MIRYLIKNNFKLMLRNKWILAAMLIGPILVIALLSSAFEDMMSSYENVEEFKVGYRVSEASIFAENIEEIKNAGKAAGIFLVNYPDGDPKTLIEKNELAGFLAYEDEGYTIYESADYQTQGAMLEYFMEQVEKQAEKQMRNNMFPKQEESITLPVQKLEFMPAVDSKNYYGIIEVVYFIWCGIVSVAGVLASEKKNGISKRFQVTPVSEAGLYWSKWIPAVLTTICEMTVTILLATVMFGISWGNIPMTILVLLVTIMGAMALGMFLYTVCQNLAVTIVALFTLVWFMGFFGGSFETYLFSSWSDTIKNLSPIYHVNRVLVEYSCMGKSDYTVSSILYMSGITVVCTGLAVLVNTIRKKGKA